MASQIAQEEIITSLVHMLSLKLRLINSLKQNLKKLGPDAMIFNGPLRSCDEKELAADVSMLRVIFSKASSETKPAELLVEQLPNTVSVSFKAVNAANLMPMLADTVGGGLSCYIVIVLLVSCFRLPVQQDPLVITDRCLTFSRLPTVT